MKRAAVLPFLLFALACGDTPTDVAPAPDALTLAGDFQGNAPAESGIIVRGEQIIGHTFIDPESGLRSIFGIYMVDFCAGNEDFDFIPVQDGFAPTGEQHRVSRGEVRTEVYPLFAFDCELFTSVGPLAQGYSTLMNLDNDQQGTSPDEINANSWGWKAHGKLTLISDGSTVIFRQIHHFVYSNTTGFKRIRTISLN